jgi:hypothetical protein
MKGKGSQILQWFTRWLSVDGHTDSLDTNATRLRKSGGSAGPAHSDVTSTTPPHGTSMASPHRSLAGTSLVDGKTTSPGSRLDDPLTVPSLFLTLSAGTSSFCMPRRPLVPFLRPLPLSLLNIGATGRAEGISRSMPESAFEVLVCLECRLIASTRDGAEAHMARSSSKQANIFISPLSGWIVFPLSLGILLLLLPPLGLLFYAPKGPRTSINGCSIETSG